jgi:enoyl-[acyl-carrier-protein] reductase (NADH)
MADRLRAHNPLHLALEPPDIAGAYVFLASASARGITGSIVTVDAGASLRMPR